MPTAVRTFGSVCAALTMTLVASDSGALQAEDPRGAARASQLERGSEKTLLSPEQWTRLDHAVDSGLSFLSRQQQADGSFPTKEEGQPGVTSLCVMAFLARGHQPGKGEYGPQIERAIDYVLSLQDPDVGALMADRWVGPGKRHVSRLSDGKEQSYPGNYNHGISGVMLGEVYGMTSANRRERIRNAIVRALEYTRGQQTSSKRNPADSGGWRYVHRRTYPPNDSDLSITAWQMIFLRSARNAEFNVPQQWVDEAMRYVHRTFDADERGFVYALSGDERYCDRAMVGAGIVCLALGGEHKSQTAQIAGDWILHCSFSPYGISQHPDDRYHYSAFYCSQAMFQRGRGDWRRFFPKLLDILAGAQRRDGSWDAESGKDREYGNAYTTALAVLTLAPPYQILPIYQR